MGLADIKKKQRQVIGERLRAARVKADYSQAEFGHVVGADRVTVSRWETGASGIGADFQEAIKQALGVDDSFFDHSFDKEMEDLRIMNRSLMDRVKALESQLNGRTPSPLGGRNKLNKPLKRR